MLDNLNPLFNEASLLDKKRKKIETKKLNPMIPQKRATRKDKGHSAKFPVTIEQQKAFKSSLIRFKYYFPNIEIQQTKYNTFLLWYALDNIHIVDWELDYVGTSKLHMTTKLPEYRYEEIGGINGISLEKGISERKAIFLMTLSALKFIEKGGHYNEIIQQIRAVKG